MVSKVHASPNATSASPQFGPSHIASMTPTQTRRVSSAPTSAATHPRPSAQRAADQAMARRNVRRPAASEHTGRWCKSLLGRSTLALPQHPHQHRPQRPILLAVEQRSDEHRSKGQVLLAVDQGSSANVRVFGFPQSSPIRSARSKSGASERGAARRGERDRARPGAHGADAPSAQGSRYGRQVRLGRLPP